MDLPLLQLHLKLCLNEQYTPLNEDIESPLLIQGKDFYLEISKLTVSYYLSSSRTFPSYIYPKAKKEEVFFKHIVLNVIFV